MSQRGQNKQGREIIHCRGSTKVIGELKESSFGTIMLVEASLE